MILTNLLMWCLITLTFLWKTFLTLWNLWMILTCLWMVIFGIALILRTWTFKCLTLLWTTFLALWTIFLKCFLALWILLMWWIIFLPCLTILDFLAIFLALTTFFFKILTLIFGATFLTLILNLMINFLCLMTFLCF